MLIVDTSAVIPFVLADEAQHRSDVIAEAMREKACLAPALWPWEMANALWKALRFGRLKEDELDGVLHDIDEFGIAIERDSIGTALGHTLMLANRYGLTAYDAAYLELALRVGAELATYDDKLRSAAVAEGVVLHPAP